MQYILLFFLFIHYSRATYGDHGENMYSPFPVRYPRSGGSLQAPLCPPPRPVPRRSTASHQGDHKGKDKPREASEYDKGKGEGKNRLHRPCGRHEVGCGQEQRRFPPSARLLGPRSLLLHPLPHLQLRHRAHRVLLCLRRNPPSNIRRGEEVQHCPAATRIGQEVARLPPVLPPPGLLLNLRPQDFLLRLPFGALLEEVVPGLRSVPAPPALWGGSPRRPVQVLPGQAVPRLQYILLGIVLSCILSSPSHLQVQRLGSALRALITCSKSERASDRRDLRNPQAPPKRLRKCAATGRRLSCFAGEGIERRTRAFVA